MSEKPSFPPFSAPSLVAFLALLGGVAAVGSRSLVAPPTPVAVSDKDAPLPPDPDPMVVLAEHFDYGTAPEEKPTPGEAAKPRRRADFNLPHTHEREVDLEFLVCTVPDPIDSKFAHAFDSTVDAIGRAYQARDYVLQSSWMPWKRDAVGRGTSDDTHRRVPGILLYRKIRKNSSVQASMALVCLVGDNPSSGLHPRALTESLRCYERLRVSAKLAGQRLAPSAEEPLRIVGPYYSGSQGILRDTLIQWQRGHGLPDIWPRFQIISGTATSVKVDQYFPDKAPWWLVPNFLPQPYPSEAARKSVGACFGACVGSVSVGVWEAAVETHFKRYGSPPKDEDWFLAAAGYAGAAILGARTHRIELIVRAAGAPSVEIPPPKPPQSPFGRHWDQPLGQPWNQPFSHPWNLNWDYLPTARPPKPSMTFQATAIQSEHLEAAVQDYLEKGAKFSSGKPDLGKIAHLRESNTGWGVRVHQESNTDWRVRVYNGEAKNEIDLPFPSSISQVQLDLDKLMAAAPAPVPALTLQADFLTPKMPVREGIYRDGVPLYDRDTTVALAADMIRNILTTIRREGVRYVNIGGSDARDIVFLNRLIRKHCPGVRTFTTETSLMYIRPEEAYHMRGMVIASAYPLYLPNQRWTEPARGDKARRLPFASDAAQGVYNAVLAQFGGDELMIEYRPPHFAQGQWKPNDIRYDRPPIWITVVGANGEPVPVGLQLDYRDGCELTDPGYDRNELYTYIAKNKSHPKEQPEIAQKCPGDPEVPTPEKERSPKSVEIVLSPGPSAGLLLLTGLVAAIAVAVAWCCWAHPWRRAILGLPVGPISLVETFGKALCWVGGLLLVAPLVPLLAACRFETDTHLNLCFGGWNVACAAVVVALGSSGAAALALLVEVFGWLGVKPAVWPQWNSRRRNYTVFMLYPLVVGAGYVLIDQFHWAFTAPLPGQFLWLIRAADLSSGLSPLLPTTLLGAAVSVAGRMCVKQGRMLATYPFDPPFPAGQRFGRLWKKVRLLRDDCPGENWRFHL